MVESIMRSFFDCKDSTNNLTQSKMDEMDKMDNLNMMNYVDYMDKMDLSCYVLMG